MKIHSVLVFLISIGFLAASCGSRNDEAIEIQEYTGPVIETGPAINYYSDSAVVKMRMEAPKQLDFRNGDREFPQGLFLQFYENGKMSSTLRADYCYYTAEDDLYKATGNVVIKRADNNDRLDTEELYWNQKEGDIFTDKYVMIQEGGQLIKGVGLEAKQDFSYYKILETKGSIFLDNEAPKETDKNEVE